MQVSRLMPLMALVFVFFCSFLSAVETDAEEEAEKKENSRVRAQRTEAFYKTISERSESHWLLRRVYPMVFKTESAGGKMRWEDANYDEWDGKRIASISILNLDVFNARKSLRRNKAYMTMLKVGNALHIDTREWVVRENLLFKEGQSIKHSVLKRNLSYLNGLEYVSEAYILVLPTEDSEENVDVVVLIRDKFSLYPGFEASSKSKFQLKLNDHNFLGWGQQLHNTWHIDSDRQSSVGWESFYSVANIRGTFIQGDLSWQDIPGYTRKSFVLDRPFLYPALKNSGGFSVSDTYVHPPVDSLIVSKVVLGGWFARSFAGKSKIKNRYKYAAFSVEQLWHRKHPEVTEDTGRLWHDRVLMLGSLALTQSHYGHLKYTYSFLENERLPLGFLVELPFGYEINEYANREFVAFRGAMGRIVFDDAYLFIEGNLETFIRKGRSEQGVLCLKPMIITPLQYYGSYSTRCFYRARLTLGNDRFRGETLELSSDPFYRGNVDLSGTNVLSFSFERDFNAPWNILGFNASFYGYVDGAVVTNRPLRPMMDEIVVSEGLGIRLRNPRLVWRSTQLQVAWVQSYGKFGSPRFSISTSVPVKLLQFEGRRPKPYEF